MCSVVICINRAHITKSKRVLWSGVVGPPGACQPCADNCEKFAFFRCRSAIHHVTSSSPPLRCLLQNGGPPIVSALLLLLVVYPPGPGHPPTPRRGSPFVIQPQDLNKLRPCRFALHLCRFLYYGDGGYLGVFCCWFIGKTDRPPTCYRCAARMCTGAPPPQPSQQFGAELLVSSRSGGRGLDLIIRLSRRVTGETSCGVDAPCEPGDLG